MPVEDLDTRKNTRPKRMACDGRFPLPQKATYTTQLYLYTCIIYVYIIYILFLYTKDLVKNTDFLFTFCYEAKERNPDHDLSSKFRFVFLRVARTQGTKITSPTVFGKAPKNHHLVNSALKGRGYVSFQEGN